MIYRFVSSEGGSTASGDSGATGTFAQQLDFRIDWGASMIDGCRIESCIATVKRSDGHVFYLLLMEAGGVMVLAGCRWKTIEEYRFHARRVSAATMKETLAILRAFEEIAAIQGHIQPVSEKKAEDSVPQVGPHFTQKAREFLLRLAITDERAVRVHFTADVACPGCGNPVFCWDNSTPVVQCSNYGNLIDCGWGRGGRDKTIADAKHEWDEKHRQRKEADAGRMAEAKRLAADVWAEARRPGTPQRTGDNPYWTAKATEAHRALIAHGSSGLSSIRRDVACPNCGNLLFGGGEDNPSVICTFLPPLHSCGWGRISQGRDRKTLSDAKRLWNDKHAMDKRVVELTLEQRVAALEEKLSQRDGEKTTKEARE